MVGHHFVDALRSRDHDREWRVTVVGEESRRAYDRVNLSTYFDDGADALHLAAEWHDDPAFTVYLRESVEGIDRVRRVVRTDSGREIDYDTLVLATGSKAFVPPVPGHDLDGCFVYRTIDDLDAIRVAAEAAGADDPSGLVVGGGLLGLEAARALNQLGVSPTVVELAPRLMPQQVDEGGAQLLRRLVEELEVDVRLGVSIERIEQADGRLRAVLSDGPGLDVDVVVFAAGIRPRDELARDAELGVGERGGVLVDRQCRTEDDAIFAIGECASVEGTAYGLVAPGYSMSEVVAEQLTGGEGEFTEADTSTKLKLLGVDVASFGDALAATDGALEVTVNDPVARTYAKLVVSDDATTLLGGVLVGDASKYSVLRPLVGRGLPADPLAMISPQGAGVSADALPDDAQICTCHAVTKGAIGEAIADGASDVPALKSCTKAGTGCGSCVPLLTTLLSQSGVEVSTGLCEHFEQSRAELFDIVKCENITTFSDLVERHGTGRGCDVCKPTAASILNALGRAGHLLDGEQATLQDTNDHFLANLQKNGTYSVVPRIAGGEITPEKLIVIGEVARDFELYTKITGGQRIDMFGARVEQLPDIWKRLVDAGFESGHAYGKAMRTVKSCVGSTWCRYGVQDSVSLAVELELRYRGLRTPHKFKSGVSGCARECAEAQSKDFGVIATEKGWNLYVGGNGGFRPKHAQLFLQDVDRETLIRTVDRFLMFYVRTADRLQRTAPWLDSLDGGIDYLRSVLVDDELGVCGELDAAIAEHVENYSDEWADTLADPERLSRFVSFVNAPDVVDPDIAFDEQRGQRRPLPMLS